MQQLNRIIKVYAAEHNVTQKWVAEQLGMSYESLRLKRHGKRDLSFADAVAISKLTGLSLDELAERLAVA